MKRTLILSLAAVLCALGARAATVTEEMASKAIGNWRVRKDRLETPMGEKVSGVRRVEHNGAAFHVVRFEGGGFVVAPTDTKVRPVIMFSEGDDLEVDDNNPAIALLVDELAARAAVEKSPLSTASATPTAAEAAWDELLADASPFVKMSKSSVSDVRVAALVKSNWNQKDDTSGNYCYNYYTPNHYACGCVATAASQLMRYFQYPTTSVSSFTRTCSVSGTSTSLTAQGGVYDWSQMPYTPGYGTTEAQRQMIGKLTSDVGIALGMGYTSTGSGSNTIRMQYALKTHFGYPQFPVGIAANDVSSAIDDSFGEVMRANFDAKLPVGLGIPGHSIVGDGYGYIGTNLYYHLNMGWGKSYNVWYAPPDDLKAESSGFTGFHSCCHNIYTNAAMSGKVIASGRITDPDGKAKQGVTVWAENAKGQQVGDAATSDEHGIYALFVAPGTYTVRAHGFAVKSGREVGEYDGSTTAKPLTCYSISVLESGSYYKGSGDLRVEGNDSGCDIALALTKYDPEATVAFNGETTLGTDFGSMTVPVKAQVVDFGYDYTSAKVVVSLTLDGAVCATKSFTVKDLNVHEESVTFTGLTPGARYVLNAAVVFGTETVATEEGYRVTAAQLARVDRPETAVLASDEVVMNVRIDGFTAKDRLAAPSAPSALTAIEQTDGSGKFAYWDGTAWQETSVAAELHATNEVSVIRIPDGGRKFRVKKGESWIDLGPLPEDPTVFSQVAVTGAAEMVALYGIHPDANRIGCTDGSAKYEDLTAAIAAGETRTITPLWATVGKVPTNVRLLTLSIADPNGLLSLSGGTLITTKQNADGSTMYCYGTMSKTAVESSDYLRATSALGLANPIQDASKVRMGDFEAAADGALSFKVTIGDEEVMSQHVKDYVRIATDLANPSWRAPGDSEISVAAGTVTVQPKTGKDRAFVQVEIPKD